MPRSLRNVFEHGIMHGRLDVGGKNTRSFRWFSGTAAILAAAVGSPLSAARAQHSGDVFQDCWECPKMVAAPEGTYMMGSPESEKGRSDDEGPVHRVAFERPFAVAVCEVTFEEWDACVSDGGCNGYRPDDEGWGRGRRPVINVSWEDAQAYVKWLSRKTGKGYRLLSESEWEYVARAGKTGRYGRRMRPWRFRYGDWGTVEVGSYRPNAFGLHDVHGNVWEWVEDCWNEGYRGAPTDGSAWGSGTCAARVSRGGSWIDDLWNLRLAKRFRVAAGTRGSIIGFRVARTLD